MATALSEWVEGESSSLLYAEKILEFLIKVVFGFERVGKSNMEFCHSVFKPNSQTSSVHAKVSIHKKQ